MSPALTQIHLVFDKQLTSDNVRLELQEGDGLDRDIAEEPKTQTLQIMTVGSTLEMDATIPGHLERNRYYTLWIRDANAEDELIIVETAITFATGILPPGGPTEQARGRILTDLGQPIAAVKVRVESTGETVLTDQTGSFVFKYALLGHQSIELNAHPVGEMIEYATLHFPLEVIAGFTGALRAPVYLPKLDLEHAVAVNRDAVTVVTNPAVPGFKLTIQPGSARYPNGTVPLALSVTEVSVKNPPMGAPAGTVFDRLYTIQPPGVFFVPPADVEYPAPPGIPENSIVPLTHYDMGPQRWVSYGRARVVKDGDAMILRSLPGEGAVRTAWQAPTPQVAYTEVEGWLADDCIEGWEKLKLAVALLQLCRSYQEVGRTNLLSATSHFSLCASEMLVSARDLRKLIMQTRISLLRLSLFERRLATFDVFQNTLGTFYDWGQCVQKASDNASKIALALMNAQRLCDQSDQLWSGGDSSGCIPISAIANIQAAMNLARQSAQESEVALLSNKEWAETVGGMLVGMKVEGPYKDMWDWAKRISEVLQPHDDGQPDGSIDPDQALVELESRLSVFEGSVSTSVNAEAKAMAALASLQRALSLMDSALSKLTFSFQSNLGTYPAVAGGITAVAIGKVPGHAAGSQVAVSGRFATVFASGSYRLHAVPAGITVGGGLVQRFSLTPIATSSMVIGQFRDDDHDGMPDDWEVRYGLDPARDDSMEDPDDDGLTNVEEYLFYGDPHDRDTDKNGRSDGEDVRAGRDAKEQGGDPEAPGLTMLDPAVAKVNDTVTIRGDAFGDQAAAIRVLIGTLEVPAAYILSVADNIVRFKVPTSFVPADVAVLRATSRGTKTSNVIFLDTDSDGDGLGDRLERLLGTNPFRSDTDGDGLSDGEEQRLRTDPLKADTDGDGLDDGFEVRLGTDPLKADSNGNGVNDGDEDFDEDGIPNKWEQWLGTDPKTKNSPVQDSDGDGLPDVVELRYGGDPRNPDTDGDGITDGVEALTARTRVNENDTDSDGLSDGTEYYGRLGNPLVAEDHSLLVIGNQQVAEFRGGNTVRELIVLNGGKITTAESDKLLAHRIEIHADRVLVEQGGLIDAAGLGYRGGLVLSGSEKRGYSFGNTVVGSHDLDAGAGSHGGGGLGRKASSTEANAGATYGRFDEPTTAGAGGNGIGTWASGGDGGGVIRLDTKDIIINGTIDASGASLNQVHECVGPYPCNPWRHAGPGAGGSILITADKWSGTGVVRADGGSALDSLGPSYEEYGGGGGRIAVRLATSPGTEPSLSARGGKSNWYYGCFGTIYRSDPLRVNGTLQIDGDTAKPRGATVIPGFSLLEVQGVGHYRVYLSTSALLPGQLRGLEVCDEHRDAVGRIAANGSDWVELESGVSLPGVGAKIETRIAVGRLQGAKAGAMSWSGLVQLLGGDKLIDQSCGGSWVGDALDFDESIELLKITDGTISGLKVTRKGSANLKFSQLLCDGSNLVLPGRGILDVPVLTLSRSTMTCGMKITAGLVNLAVGSSLMPPPSVSGIFVPVEIDATEVIVEKGSGNVAASRIDASGRGFVGGVGTPLYQQYGETWPGAHTNGARPSSSADGGSHAGLGGAPSTAMVYGNWSGDQAPGGGGGYNSFSVGQGGNGGGTVLINATSVTVDGEILANGSQGLYIVYQVGPQPCQWMGTSGAGAGGSIEIHATNLHGAGLLSAVGGKTVYSGQAGCNSSTCPQLPGRAGGGGRIAITSDTSDFSGAYRAHGGLGTSGLGTNCSLLNSELTGGAGTVWLFKPGTSVYGDVIVDNNGQPTPIVSTPLVTLPLGTGTATADGTGKVLHTSVPIYSDVTGLTYGHVGRFVIVDGDMQSPRRIVAHGKDWFEVDLALQPNLQVVYRGAIYADSLRISGKAFVGALGERVVIPGGAPIIEAGSTLKP